ncbi:hypothetical protein C6497_06420 [Candidatus Poribacteria bacterium]|nr:MAG: hypothetical protein C6497_06420 [Candidatus Poribacteria bacterium]
MAKREEFIQIINTFKSVSATITDYQRRGLLQQAVNIYNLSIGEGIEILDSLGIVVGDEINHFDILGLSLEEIQGMEDQSIAAIVRSAHDNLYKASLTAGARIRSDGRTEDQWRMLLNQARDILIDTGKRNEYISSLLHEESVELTTPNTPMIQRNEPNSIQTSESLIEPTPNKITDPAEIEIPTDMVLIRSGVFMLGSQREDINGNDISLQNIYLNGFLIDKYPVTNTEFSVFLTENEQWQKNNISNKYHNGNYLSSWNGNKYPRNRGNDPVVDVCWYAAMAYAQWKEKRLPTDIEWEKAARGGLTEKTYPWGDNITNDLANYGMVVGSTTPVGTYPPNEYGVYDMVGNVWEWCLNPYSYNSPEQRPGISAEEIQHIVNTYLAINSNRVLRGGSWASSERSLRVGYKGSATPDFTYYSYGFRCVKDLQG